MLLTSIQEQPPPTASLAVQDLPQSDYNDTFAAQLPPGEVATVDDLARRFFEAQPGWLRAISMHVPRRTTLDATLAATTFAPGQRVGAWHVRARNEREIVFGESLGFLTYCFTLRLDHSNALDRVTAATRARFDSPFGRFYFSVVRGMHRIFVRMTLRNTVRHVIGMP